LAALFSKGVALFTPEQQYRRFAHANVKLIAFSPQEHYLITFAPVENDDPKQPKVFNY